MHAFNADIESSLFSTEILLRKIALLENQIEDYKKQIKKRYSIEKSPETLTMNGFCETLRLYVDARLHQDTSGATHVNIRSYAEDEIRYGYFITAGTHISKSEIYKSMLYFHEQLIHEAVNSVNADIKKPKGDA